MKTYRTPPFLLPIYLAAAQRYGVPWQVLAAINEVETNYGLDLGPSSAGAEGWMQFLPEEWLIYGVDANGTGMRDPDNPADAIFATARYLAAAGASHDLRGAIYAYNHSASYVESVMLRTQLLAATPQSLISSLSAIASGRFPVAGGGSHAVTAAWSKPPQASIAASPGSPVLAVQTAEVIQIGRNATLGRFIKLRDVYGNTYTYAHLGHVLKRRGTWLAAGTVLGSVGAGPPGSQVHFLFAIRPAGAGPIDPLPLLQSWQLLDETQGHTQQGAQPLFGPDSREALIDETQSLRKRQLRSRVRRDPALNAVQWRKLLTRISRITEPHVPSAPTRSAVADNPDSPLPRAEPLPGRPAPCP